MLQNTVDVRINNKKLIKKNIALLGVVTKNDICRQTNLSFATCNTLMNELAESGEIMVLSETIPCGGRPSTAYMLNYDYGQLCGMVIDEQSSHYVIRTFVTDLNKKFLYDERSTVDTLEASFLFELLQGLCSQFHNILEIGISVGGVVNKQNEIFSYAQPELNRCRLSEMLEKKLGIPVFTENNMNLVAYGAWSHEKYMDYESIVAFNKIYGKCGGAGYVCDGNILRGSNHFAGEIGFIPMNYESFEDQILKISATFTSILNPECIIAFSTAEDVARIDMKEIERHLNTLIPNPYCPKLFIENELEKETMLTDGLMDLCLRREDL